MAMDLKMVWSPRVCGNLQAEKVWSGGFMSQNMEILCVRLQEITESDVIFQNTINMA